MKNLFFAFNLEENDFTGLPTYCIAYLKYNKDDIVVNIIPDQNNEYKIEWVGTNRINCYFPDFYTSFYSELSNIVADVIEERDITRIIIPDYILQEYFENKRVVRLIQERNIEKVLFIHLLYRGLQDTYQKQPYFKNLIGASAYLAKNSWYEWRAIFTSHTILANSYFTEREIRKHYGEEIQGKKLVALPLGVDKETYPYIPANNSKKWAYFGRLTPQKGMFYITKDIVENMDKYKANPLIVCGEGELDHLFMKAHFYDKTVDYKGLLNKQQLIEVLKDVKYCIFPSIYEPYGLALNEAMAMGKICIISHRDSGMIEQIQRDNAFVFNFENESIVNMIEMLEGMDINFDEISYRARLHCNDEKEHFKNLQNLLM